VFSSRLDKEKNPYFMLEVAKEFLQSNPEYTWIVTSSGNSLKSTLPGIVDELYKFSKENDRFIIRTGLTKQEYYTILAESHIQFNSSLQDYVSWTVIESTMFGCIPVFPNFRSFPEFIPSTLMYTPFNKKDAANVLYYVVADAGKWISYDKPTLDDIAVISNYGRLLEAWIISNDYQGPELNVWHELDYIKKLLNV